MHTLVAYVLVLDLVLTIIAVALGIAVASTRSPWVIPAGATGIVLIAAVLVLHRHRRRAEYGRWRAERAARRQRRGIRGA